MGYIMETELGALTIINKKMVDYFGGCGYFGFQAHHEVIEAACFAAKRYGISSATTTAGFGNNPVLIDLEEKITQFFGATGVLHYASGCMGNFILTEGLKEDYDIIFVDKDSHYSVKNAIALVHKPFVEFDHCNAEDLRRKLKENVAPGQRPMVMCDGIFPVSGELSPLPQYKAVLDEVCGGGIICVDDAHATGVIGKKGFGSFEYFGIESEGYYSSGVFSKALGGSGGLIVGKEEFVQKLKRNSALANACSTTPIPAAAATAKALEILHKQPELRQQLWDNTIYAKTRLRETGFDVNDTPVPIICLSTHKTKGHIDCGSLQKELFERNIAATHVPAGAYTSVPGTGALRISIFCTHSREQIDNLVDQIQKLI
jgi:7-keto-8-aminopelargonate synthetase-like enzyme